MVVIPSVLCDELNAYREQAPYNKPDDYIFTRLDRHSYPTHLSPQRFSEVFSRMTKRIDVGVTLHGTRHSIITMLRNQGINAADVAARVGHSDSMTTERIYTHATYVQQQRAVEIIEELLLHGMVKQEQHEGEERVE